MAPTTRPKTLTKRAEGSQQPPRQPERQMRGFAAPAHAQRGLARSRGHAEAGSRGSAPAQVGAASDAARTIIHRVGRGDRGLIL